MEINLFFATVALYGVAYKVDVKVGEKFTMQFTGPESADDVFSNNDEVLAFKRNGEYITIEAKEVGVSKVWITNGQTIIREILFNIVDSIQMPATSLNANLGEPVNK